MKVPLNIFPFQDLLHIVQEDGTIAITHPPKVPKYDIVEVGDKSAFVVGRGWKQVNERMLSLRDWSKQCASYPFGYMAHLYVTNPDFVKKATWEREPRIMRLDIEVASDGSGMFPRAERNAAAMIGYKMSGDKDVTILDSFDMRAKGMEDTQLLRDFMSKINELDPDIIVTYNGWKFDIPYLRTRMEICKVPHNELFIRKGFKPDEGITIPGDHLTKILAMTEGKNARSNMAGRLSYDIYAVDVMKDQKLMGLENKKMKTLAKYFLTDKESDSIIELETGIKNIMDMMKTESGRSELREYLTSDVNITERLEQVYIGQNIEFAEKLNVPLGQIMSRTSGGIATLHMMKEMLKSDIIAVDNNYSRYYDEFYKLSLENGFSKDFQGALVGIYRTGKIKNMKKYDFRSLYPSLIQTFNLSYETVRFDSINDILSYQEDFIINKDEQNNELILGIPDEILKRTIVVHIDLSERGMVPKMLDSLLDERSKLKEEIKGLEKGDIKFQKLDSQQWYIKVCANSAYGILANRYTIGYLPIGITITGMGRYFLKEVMQFLRDKSGPECVIEVDTDGVITTADLPVKEINTYIQEIVKTKFGITDNKLELEEEEFDAGYFYKMKNYIVREKGGKIIKHGAAFKSSKAAAVHRRAVNFLTDYAINETLTAEQCKTQSLDFANLPVEDYMLSMRMSKNVEDYGMTGGKIKALSDDDNFNMHATSTFADRVATSSSSLVVSLVNQYQTLFGFTPSGGDVLEYIVVKSPLTGKKEYEPLNVHDSTQLGRIDNEYYFEMVERILGDLIHMTNEDQEAIELVDIFDVSGNIL